MKLTFGKLAAVAGALLSVAGCSDNSSSGVIAGGAGQVSVLLTDAPFPFSEVKRVDVFVVRIDGKIADINDTEADNESDMSDWKTLVSPNTSINLLDLTNGKTANLGVGALPAGTYQGFRLIIDTDKSSITLNDGTKPDVKWPGAGKHGIKINLDAPVVIGPATPNLLIDFDVGRSFVMRGHSIKNNGLIFKPAIRATTQQSTGIVTGSVHGDNAAGPVVAGATVEVLKDGSSLSDDDADEIVRSGVTDASGNFTIAFIKPGTYVLRATPPAASVYKPAILTGVTITAGTTTSGKVIVVLK
jgi:hypothetical protein